jgi:adenine-specific DNA-methyltransferase
VDDDDPVMARRYVLETTPLGDVVGVVRGAIDLGARGFGGSRSAGEDALVARARRRPALTKAQREYLREAIIAGDDPLGEALQAAYDREIRRKSGTFYTPSALVHPMVSWIVRRDVDVLVDPGCGSGRFAAEAVRQARELPVIAIDNNPAATLVTRATLRVLGAADATVIHDDFLRLDAVPRRKGARAGWIGNPPFVRHQALSKRTKQHGIRIAAQAGHPSQMTVNLHLLFFAKTKTLSQPGDVGCYITSAEWMDNRTGRLVRRLFLDGLGGTNVTIVDPASYTFVDVQTTAALTRFSIGDHDGPKRFAINVPLADVAEHLADDAKGTPVDSGRLTDARGWTQVVKNPLAAERSGPTIGDLFFVNRGTATGSNAFFVFTPERARELHLSKYTVPTVVRAYEIISANGILRRQDASKVVLDLPKDFARTSDSAVDAYLKTGERQNDQGVVVANVSNARNRRPWWHLNISRPPIVVTYMARRPPVFASNPDRLGILNIAIALRPKVHLLPEQIDLIVSALNDAAPTFVEYAVTYFGDLKKFEPKVLAALPLPTALHSLLPSGGRVPSVSS